LSCRTYLVTSEPSQCSTLGDIRRLPVHDYWSLLAPLSEAVPLVKCLEFAETINYASR
jgi:hypothetical protein